MFDSHGVWLRRYLFPARTVQDSKLLTDALSTDQLRDELNIVTSSEVVGRVDHGAFSSYDARDTATNWIPLHTWRRNESHNHGAGRFWTFAYGGNVQELFPDGQVRTIDRRPDRTWLRTGYPIAVSPEGRAAVVDARQGLFGQPCPLENDLVCLYNADGSPDRVLTTPRAFTGAAIAYDGHRIVLVKGAHAVCLDMRGHVVWSSTIGAAGGEPTLIDNGRILCIWPGGDTIERYRMP